MYDLLHKILKNVNYSNRKKGDCPVTEDRMNRENTRKSKSSGNGGHANYFDYGDDFTDTYPNL